MNINLEYSEIALAKAIALVKAKIAEGIFFSDNPLQEFLYGIENSPALVGDFASFGIMLFEESVEDTVGYYDENGNEKSETYSSGSYSVGFDSKEETFEGLFEDASEVVVLREAHKAYLASEEVQEFLKEKALLEKYEYSRALSELWWGLSEDRAERGELLKGLCPITLGDIVVTSIRESQGGVRWWVTVSDGVEEVAEGLLLCKLNEFAENYQGLN